MLFYSNVSQNSKMESGELVMKVMPEDSSPLRSLLVHTEALTDSKDGHIVKLVGSCQDVSLITTYAENLQNAQVSI